MAIFLPPNPDTISGDVPAALIWRFRIASLSGNMLLWSTLALGFGALCAEAVRRRAEAGADAGAGAGAAAPPLMSPASVGGENIVKL
jgi:predicted cobalt transporter CbtA